MRTSACVLLSLQYTALEAKMCQVESKYLVLLQEVKTPMCSLSEQNPAHEVISRLLEDALQAESPEQQEHPIFKPNTVRYAHTPDSLKESSYSHITDESESAAGSCDCRPTFRKDDKGK